MYNKKIKGGVFILFNIIFMGSLIALFATYLVCSPICHVDKDKIDEVNKDGLIHFTTPENAAAIIKNGEFIGSTAGLVFPATVILGKQVWTYQFKGLDDVEQKHNYLLNKTKVKKNAANFSVCLKLSGFDEKDLKRIRTRFLHDKPIVFKTDILNPEKITVVKEWGDAK